MLGHGRAAEVTGQGSRLLGFDNFGAWLRRGSRGQGQDAIAQLWSSSRAERNIDTQGHCLQRPVHFLYDFYRTSKKHLRHPKNGMKALYAV